MAARITLNAGDVFAGYTIESMLGEGGMGTVYRARDPDLPRSVALKLLHRDLTANDYIRSRFELEAAHAARLEHPNIVTVYRRGREDDQLWIAMQFIDTTDAAAAVEDGPLEPARALHIVAETAKALDYAHAAGVLHRDVKPANILLERSGPGRTGRVLLADFGIAKALAETAQLTSTGMLVASLQYASPEQFDNVELDARADVYSLGCTLFHLLTGELPYQGTTLPQLWAGHVKAPIPKPSGLRPWLPHALDAVVERAMAKERDDRYPSCGEFAAAAQAALLGPPTAPPLPPDTKRPAPTAIDEARTQRQTPPVAPPPRFVAADPVQDPTQLAPRPQPVPSGTRGGADAIWRVVARVGLILLVALICAALITWRRHSGYYSYYYGYWKYYTVYQPLWLHINTSLYNLSKVAFGLIIAVGVVLMLAAAAMIRTRRSFAGRLALTGAGLLVFGLFTLELAIHSGVPPRHKETEMLVVALVGAVLLLVGCWRGLSPSKRNALWLILPGVATSAAAIGLHFKDFGMAVPVLGQGWGGLIAGLALTAAGIMLAVRRPRGGADGPPRETPAALTERA